jgi:hypothetical protein
MLIACVYCILLFPNSHSLMHTPQIQNPFPCKPKSTQYFSQNKQKHTRIWYEINWVYLSVRVCVCATVSLLFMSVVCINVNLLCVHDSCVSESVCMCMCMCVCVCNCQFIAHECYMYQCVFHNKNITNG